MRLPSSHYFNINKGLNSYGVLATRMGSIFLQNFIAYGEGELFNGKIELTDFPYFLKAVVFKQAP